MPREKLAFHRNNIIRNYANGMSATSIGREFGVSTTTVTRILKGAGVMIALGRGDHTRRADEQAIVSAFRQGIKPAYLCRQFDVSKSGLYAILNRAGADLRGHIDEFRTEAELIHLAKIREERGACNENEQLFRDLMSERGIECTPQVALGIGVVDFVIRTHSVAVEVNLRGTFGKYVANGWFTQRIKDCAHRGWHFYVFGGRDTSDINASAIEDVLAWLDFLDRSPASRRQYRVIWGGSELLATGCSDDDKVTIPMPSDYATKVADRKG